MILNILDAISSLLPVILNIFITRRRPRHKRNVILGGGVGMRHSF